MRVEVKWNNACAVYDIYVNGEWTAEARTEKKALRIAKKYDPTIR